MTKSSNLRTPYVARLQSSTDIVQHIAQSRLLQSINAQGIVLLHLDPSTNVLALVRHSRRKPLSRVAVSLLTVASGADGKQLRASQATRSQSMFRMLVGRVGTHSLAYAWR
jgi:hypothetical protein